MPRPDGGDICRIPICPTFVRCPPQANALLNLPARCLERDFFLLKPSMLSLADLREGQVATILEVSGEDAIAVRLMEMGLTDGERIKLVGFAPMGDPLEILIRGYRLSLRCSEAKRVIVELAS